MSEILAGMMGIVAYVLVGISWIIVPLIPTVLIYRLFPNNTIVVSGPFSGLTVKATGAFAGYLIVFFLMYMKLGTIYDAIDKLTPEYWFVTGNIKLQGPNGNELKYTDYRDRLVVKLRPIQEVDEDGKISLRLPLAVKGEHTDLVITMQDFGSARITLNEQKEGRDAFNKTLKLKPIILTQEANTTQDAVSSKRREDQPFIDNSVLPKLR